MSSAEPIGVAFVEIEPVATGFRAKTETQIRSQLAGVSAGVPPVAPSPATAATTQQFRELTVAAGQATTAEELLARAQGELAAVTAPLAALEGHAAKAHVAAARAASADAFAQKALVAITEETSAATIAEIEALAAKTRALNIAAAAEERAALGAESHAAASTHATEAILAETASMSGLRGASLGVNPVFLAATAGAIAFFESAKLADDFNEQMHLIEETTHSTSDEIDRAAATARGLGSDLSIPATSAVESATAIRLLTQSGFDLDDSLTAARGSLLLTAASGETLEGSVREVDRLLDAFRLKADDAERAADAVATGLKFTQGSAEEFAGALATLAPAADSVGLSLEETNTLVLQLSESGLAAGAGASTLRQAFLRLARGGKDVNEGLAEIGLSLKALRDAEGNLRPDAFVRIAEAMKGLDRAERLRILTQIFSRRAALGVIRIVDQEREGFERMTKASLETGVAQGLAEARTKSLGGTIRETKDEAADFATVLGAGVLPVATSLAAGTGDLFHGLNLLAGGFLDLVDPPKEATNSIGAMRRELDQAREDLRRFAASGGDPLAIKLMKIHIQELTKALRDLGVEVDAEGTKFNIFGAIAAGVDGTIKDLVASIGSAGTAAQNQVNQVGETLTTQLAIAEAGGNEADQLRILRQQSANAIKRQQAARANPNLNQTQANAQITKAAQDQKAADDKIQGILDGRASDAKAAAAAAKKTSDDIEKAADERDRNFIGALERRRQTKVGAVTAAADTDTLADDIRADVKQRNFLRNAIDNVRARIRDARAAGHSTEALVAELDSLRSSRNDVRREIARLNADAKTQAREARVEARATRVESASLDLQILEERVGDDPTAKQAGKLVAAHQRVITALKRAQGLTKKRSVEWKRLQLEIAQEQAAIRDLKNTQKKGQDAALGLKKQEFEFLQTIQGFSANVMGNLIPGFATAGTVGGQLTSGAGTTTTGGSSPFVLPREQASGIGFPTQRGRAGPGAGPGPHKPVSAGQGNTQITLLRMILHELKHGNRGREHPEARQQRRVGAAAIDYATGGTHGM